MAFAGSRLLCYSCSCLEHPSLTMIALWEGTPARPLAAGVMQVSSQQARSQSGLSRTAGACVTGPWRGVQWQMTGQAASMHGAHTPMWLVGPGRRASLALVDVL